MTTLQLLIVCLTVLAIAAMTVGVLTARHQEPTTGSMVRAAGDGTIFEGLKAGQRVAVHTGPGQLVRGTVDGVTDAGVILAGATLISTGVEPIEMSVVRISSAEANVVQELSQPREHNRIPVANA